MSQTLRREVAREPVTRTTRGRNGERTTSIRVAADGTITGKDAAIAALKNSEAALLRLAPLYGETEL